VAYALTTRRADVAQVPVHQKRIAWLSAIVPFALQVQGSPTFIQAGIAVAGLALAAWGLFSLGKSFGIGPADRGLILHGPYHYLRHPIYAGELLALIAVLVGAPSPWNAGVVGFLLLTVLLRNRWEERALGGYSSYAHRVRWRLMPGLW